MLEKDVLHIKNELAVIKEDIRLILDILRIKLLNSNKNPNPVPTPLPLLCPKSEKKKFSVQDLKKINITVSR
jgi:hypothetical protein